MSDRESDPEEEAIVREGLEFVDSNHQASTLARLNTLRKGGHFCDVVLQVDGHNVPAHRVVLGCTSNYLFELFMASPEDGTTQHIKLENVEYESFDALIRYAYTSRLDVPDDQVRSVYKTAVMLKMHAAAEACSKHLAKNLTFSNCLGIRAFANSQFDQDLTMETDAFIQENISDVSQTSQSKTLPFVQMDILGVEENELKTESVDHLCQLAIQWAEEALGEQSLADLSSHLHKLFLAADNSLHDCNDADDAVLSSSDEVQDYKKIAKKRQKIKKRSKNPPPSPDINQHRISIFNGDRKPEETEENKVVAKQKVDDRSYMVIAMLDKHLVKISLKFHYSTSAVNGNGTVNGGSRSDDSPSPLSSPRGSVCGEKAVSLTPLARMSSPRCAVSTAVLDGKLIALGGYDRGECLNTVETFDMSTNTWQPLQHMLSARGRFDVSQCEGRLYACGGSNGSHELKSAEYYDSKLDTWEPLPDMLHWRSSSGVAMLNRKLYVVGGWSGQSGQSDCEAYDVDAGKWMAIKPMNTGRSQAGACAFEGKVIAVGGGNNWTSINTVESYDPITDTWTYLPPMGLARRGAGVAVFQGKLFVVGGSDGTSSVASIEIYNPETNSWSNGPQLSIPRANVGVAVVKNRLFAVGGFSGKAFLDSIEYLSSDASEWCSYVPVEV